MKQIFIICLTVVQLLRHSLGASEKSYFDSLENVRSTTPAPEQEKAARDLIKRTVGLTLSNRFLVKVEQAMPFRSFKITQEHDDERMLIVGSDGVSVAKGFHHYLKYYLRADVDWRDTRVDLPRHVHLPNVTIFSKSASEFIHYQNVCTWSYTFAWWSWSLWRQHIDWMAMMGITLTIAPIQEDIWHELYSDIGLTAAELDEHFAGPAFQAWQRMGNIRGWAGPLTASYRRMQRILQRRIVQAERSLGMSVALPAFAGHVPTAIARLYPNSTLTPVERWNRFPDSYCCALFLDPNDVLFQKIAIEFVQRVRDAYGSDHIYFCDPFNEIQPRFSEAAYLKDTALNIFESMRKTDDAAVWLLQGWMFVKNIFWKDDLIKAFLTAVPRGRLLVLDLQSEQFPQYERTHSYHGQPFIWCMLHNFGGTLGMHGSIEVVNTRMRKARDMSNSSMVGAGVTPEGINQNYAMYALALERAWLKDDLNLKEWFNSFADARYGVESPHLRRAWQLLSASVYSYYGLNKMRGKYTITTRPSLNLNPWTWYNASFVHAAWRELLNAENCSFTPSGNASYEHDLVDVTRQFLQITADQLYVNLLAAYNDRRKDRFNYVADKLLKIFNDLEDILASNEHFLLGAWIDRARQLGQNRLEKQLYEMNARNQITAWGQDGQILDYATKQWSGIICDYYKPRWVLFLGFMTSSLENDTKFNSAKFKKIVSNEIENRFSVRTNKYPIFPVGETIQISERVFKSWDSLTRSLDYEKFVSLKIVAK